FAGWFITAPLLPPHQTPRRCLEREDSFFASSRSKFMLEHDLFRKPVPTFRDHARANHHPHDTTMMPATIAFPKPNASKGLWTGHARLQEVARISHPPCGRSVPNAHALVLATTSEASHRACVQADRASR